MKRYYQGILTLLLISALSLFPAPALADGEGSDPLSSDNVSDNITLSEYFTVVVLPDTQHYSEEYPNIFQRQTQWIVDNREEENIVAVAHAGDIVNHADNQTEWDNATEAMKILSDNGTPYITTVGNHDISSTSGLQPYNDAFGSAEAYMLFNIGEMECAIVAVNANSGYAEESAVWAQGILEQYGDKNVIILVHGYITTTGIKDNSWGVDGVYVWEHLVKPSSNIFLVLCGHVMGEGWSTDITDNGTVVNNLLADYQYFENGGNGWLRLYRFDVGMTKIEVKTYSPYLNLYRTNPESEFIVTLPELISLPAPSPPPPLVPSPSPPPASGNGGEGGGGGGYMPSGPGLIISFRSTSNPDLFLVRMTSHQRLLTKAELKELLVAYTFTLEEFEEKYGVPADASIATAQRYNDNPRSKEFSTLTVMEKHNLGLIWKEYAGKG